MFLPTWHTADVFNLRRKDILYDWQSPFICVPSKKGDNLFNQVMSTMFTNSVAPIHHISQSSGMLMREFSPCILTIGNVAE